MTLLNDRQIIKFAEGTPDLESPIQHTILLQVASSPILRQQIAQIRKDLYLIECQIPEFSLRPEFCIELQNLANLWSKLRVEKKLRAHKNLFGRKFTLLGLVTLSLLIISLVLLWSSHFTR